MNEVEIPVAKLVVCTILMLGGLFTHVVTKLSELEQRGTPTDFKSYVMRQKYTSLSVVLGCFGALFMMYEMKELSTLGSFFIGVACNSFGDKVRAYAEKKAQQ